MKRSGNRTGLDSQNDWLTAPLPLNRENFGSILASLPPAPFLYQAPLALDRAERMSPAARCSPRGKRTSASVDVGRRARRLGTRGSRFALLLLNVGLVTIQSRPGVVFRRVNSMRGVERSTRSSSHLVRSGGRAATVSSACARRPTVTSLSGFRAFAFSEFTGLPLFPVQANLWDRVPDMNSRIGRDSGQGRVGEVKQL
jgi:hypothetical protein